MIKRYDEPIEINHNPNWPNIPDPDKILIIGGSGLGKTKNVLLNLIKYFTNPFKSKYQLLVNWRKKVGIKQTKNWKVFIDYSRKIDDVYKKFKKYNPIKKRKMLAYDNRYES